MLTSEKLERIQRASRSNGPWFSDDHAADVLYDINAFTDENNDRSITVHDIGEYLSKQPKA